MGSVEVTSVEELLSEARATLRRVSPEEAWRSSVNGSALIDIRSDLQRARNGVIESAKFIPRNVLEWRLDPVCPDRIPELARPGHRIILICNEGFQSSLAAATLRQFGLDATDVVGGFQAWCAAGLPVRRGDTDHAVGFHRTKSDDG